MACGPERPFPGQASGDCRSGASLAYFGRIHLRRNIRTASPIPVYAVVLIPPLAVGRRNVGGVLARNAGFLNAQLGAGFET
jgi:hypothetical protein